MKRLLRGLLVSDDRPALAPAVEDLGRLLPELQLVDVAGEAGLWQAMSRDGADLVIADAPFAWADGEGLVQRVKAGCPDCAVVLLVPAGSEHVLQRAIPAGLDGFAIRTREGQVGLAAAVQLALERQRNRREHAEAEDSYRSLFDNVPVGFFRTTPAGQFIDANLGLVAMLRYPDRSSLLAVRTTDLYVNPRDRERWRTRLRQGAQTSAFETQLYRGDNTIIWVEGTVRVMRRPERGTAHYEGILRDISERKRTEEALRESEERFRTIVEQSPISVQVMSPDGWTMLVNRAWEELWGVTAGDLHNYNMLQDEQALSLGMMPYVERGFQGATVSLPRVAYDTPETVKIGRKRWFQAHIYPVKGAREQIRHVIMMYEDITERQWATEDLQKLSARLMNAQEAERQHISQDLHDDVGQALTAMRINLDAMAKELPPQSAGRTRERLAETRTLVDEVLDHVRELSHDLRPTMLDELGLQPTLQWYVDNFGRRLGIEADFVATGLEQRLPIGMETALYRLVQEALTNTAKHARARHVHVQIERNGTQILGTIEDDGVGFDVKRLAGVHAGARGIGMIDMRERVALYGGTLNIRSQPGHGTRLLIELRLPEILARTGDDGDDQSYSG